MATDDSSLMDEVREQTELTDAALLSDSRLSALLSNAKREIASAVESDPDWYGNQHAESALFWLVCLFVIGEDPVNDFSIGEIEVDSGSDVEHPWVARYERNLRYLYSSESLFGVVNPSRNDRSDRPVTRDDPL